MIPNCFKYFKPISPSSAVAACPPAALSRPCLFNVAHLLPSVKEKERNYQNKVSRLLIFLLNSVIILTM